MHSHFKYWMGGTKLIFQLTSRLSKHLPVEVFVEDASGLAQENYAAAGVPLFKTIGITSTSPLYWISLPFFLAKNREILRKYIDRDTVLVSSMFPMNAVLNDFPSPKCQYMFEPFAFIHDEHMIGGLPPAKRLFCRYVRRRYAKLDIEATRKADKIFTLNDITARSIQTVYGRTAIPTYTGIDTDFFRPGRDRELVRKYRGRRVLIHSTDFTPIKGTDQALKALAVVAKKYPEVLLLITSTIEDAKGLAAMGQLAEKLGIRRNVEYLGFLPYRDMPRYYAFAEALLQTGVGAMAGATSFSLPVKEAMACGTPVIRHPITTEDVEEGVSGLLIDSNDSARYAGGILRLLDQPREAREMGRRAREKIVATFNWETVVQKILENLA
jgi:glycosyltransferase involved in cell wall biosynthesis